MDWGCLKNSNSRLNYFLHKAKTFFPVFFRFFRERINGLHCNRDKSFSDCQKERHWHSLEKSEHFLISKPACILFFQYYIYQIVYFPVINLMTVHAHLTISLFLIEFVFNFSLFFQRK